MGCRLFREARVNGDGTIDIERELLKSGWLALNIEVSSGVIALSPSRHGTAPPGDGRFNITAYSRESRISPGDCVGILRYPQGYLEILGPPALRSMDRVRPEYERILRALDPISETI